MIDDDPFAPPAKKPVSLEAQIETASIHELEDRIERLRNEIVQCERAITAKRAQRAAADSRSARALLEPRINLDAGAARLLRAWVSS